MLRSAVRAARPAVLAARSSLKPKSPISIRAFSTTLQVSSGPAPPQLFGQGGKPGEVPSDIDQATGLERLQLLGELEGIDVFDESPLDSSRIGTKANPVLVPSYVRFFFFVHLPATLVSNSATTFGQSGRRTYCRLHRLSSRFTRYNLVLGKAGQAITLHRMWLWSVNMLHHNHFSS